VIFTRIDKCRLAVIHFGYVQYEARQLADLNLVSTPKIVRLCPAVVAFSSVPSRWRTKFEPINPAAPVTRYEVIPEGR
jgi:hypothetical protein